MYIKSTVKIIITTILIILCGCNNHTNKVKPIKSIKPIESATTTASHAIWKRLKNNFTLDLSDKNTTVQFYTAKYKNHEILYLQKLSVKATPHLSDILNQLEKRNMPGELALLPMIESSYNPHARSIRGAIGLWQLKLATGKRYGLKQSDLYDPKISVIASTNAALSYLQFLHNEFNGDWFLALAAYNAGEGRVRSAINKNLAKNMPTDFWSLNLPKETKDFVPKLLAMANLIKFADLNTIARFNAKSSLSNIAL